MATLAPRSTLDGWVRSPFTGGGLTYDCYEKGVGPGVVVIPEIPGMTPELLGFAQHLVDSGFTVVIPSPFGTPGREMTGGYILKSAVRLCVSAEFRAFATNAHRPITDFFRAVASDLAARTPGPGVGFIGMCFTGNFALAAAADDSVLASVMSQPALPIAVNKARQLDPGVSRAELARVIERTEKDNLCLLGLKFSEDPAVPRARFASLKEKLGDAFEVIELDSSEGNPDGYKKSAHSLLTTEVREAEQNSAWVARNRFVEFLRKQIGPLERNG